MRALKTPSLNDQTSIPFSMGAGRPSLAPDATALFRTVIPKVLPWELQKENQRQPCCIVLP
jgi:hypothetical protein